MEGIGSSGEGVAGVGLCVYVSDFARTMGVKEEGDSEMGRSEGKLDRSKFSSAVRLCKASAGVWEFLGCVSEGNAVRREMRSEARSAVSQNMSV